MRRLLGLIIALSIVSPVQGQPSISTVDPPFGYSDEETRVVLRGTGFGPEPRVSLYGGGLFVAGHWPPFAGVFGTDVAVDGELLFVGTGGFDDLYAVDMTDPRRPRILDALTWAISWGPLEVAAGHVFAANGIFGLHVIDAREPAALEPLVYLPTFRVVDLAWSDGLLFLAEGFGGLEVMDVGDPAEPVSLGRFGPRVDKVAAVGPFVFVAEPGFGVRVLDARNPRRLTVIGALPLSGTVVGLAASGNGLLVARDTPSALSVVDVSDPADPRVAGSWESPLPIASLALDGTRAYLGHHLPGGVSVIDVEDPTDPRLLAGHDTRSRVGAVDAAGRFLFALDDVSDVIVFDAATARGPDASSVLDLGGAVIDVAWKDRYAFVAVTGRGLISVDMLDPAAPVPLGETRVIADPRRVTVQDGYAYLAAGARGVWIVDVDDPEAPRIVARFPAAPFSEAVDVTVDGDTMIVAEADRDVIVVDVADPRIPREIARIPGHAGGVALEDDLLLDAQRPVFNRIDARAVDVSDPRSPRFAGEVQLPASGALLPSAALGWPLGVVGAGRWLHLLDVGDPVTPTPAARWPITEDMVHDLSLAGDRVLVADGRNELLEFDVSDPALPLLSGRYPTPGVARGVAAHDGWALVADDEEGLRAIPLDPPLRDVRRLADGRVEVTVPAGLPPGPYHLAVGEAPPAGFTPGPRPTLGNGFRVCTRRELAARLEAAGSSEYRVVLDGDPVLFGPGASTSARLSLPELPSDLEVLPVRAGPDERDRIELRILPREDRGTVRLVSTDPALLARAWQAAVETGGFDLFSIDSRTFGNLALEVRRPPAGDVERSSLRFRYELSAQRLSSARAQGHGADLVFDARATYDDVCVARGRVETAETLSPDRRRKEPR